MSMFISNMHNTKKNFKKSKERTFFSDNNVENNILRKTYVEVIVP